MHATVYAHIDVVFTEYREDFWGQSSKKAQLIKFDRGDTVRIWLFRPSNGGWRWRGYSSYCSAEVNIDNVLYVILMK